jgi:hypothetical protein
MLGQQCTAGGYYYAMVVNFICDPTTLAKNAVIDSLGQIDTCTWQVSIKADAACPSTNIDDDLSIGWIFLMGYASNHTVLSLSIFL